jgi:hypothetical protein
MSRSGLQQDPLGERRPLTSRSMSRRKVHHYESHTDYGDVIRDIIIGFADGLTVPFALTAGLSSLGSARLVIIGGTLSCLLNSNLHLTV